MPSRAPIYSSPPWPDSSASWVRSRRDSNTKTTRWPLQPRHKSDGRSESVRENELTSTVRKVMRQYFKDLDGEKASGIYEMVVAAVEKPMLEVVMFQAQGNQTRAARLLGMNRNTLRKKLQQHSLD